MSAGKSANPTVKLAQILAARNAELANDRVGQQLFAIYLSQTKLVDPPHEFGTRVAC
jgi:hypothetical protein